MADTTTDGAGESRPSRPVEKDGKRKGGGLGLFLREVIAELRKVVRPTRQELISYTSVVLAFVVFIMLLVSGLDFGINKLVGWAFGGGAL